MIKRSIKITLEILAVISMTIILVLGGVLFKISSSPMESDFLTTQMNDEINGAFDDIQFKFDSTVLSFSRQDWLLTITARNVSITNEKGAEISTINDIILQYSWSNILRLSSIPHSIVVNQPQISFQKNAVGTFEIHHMDMETDQNSRSEINTKDSGKRLYDGLKKILGLRSGLLERVVIADAIVLYEDALHNLSLSAPSVTLDISKNKSGLTGFVNATVDLGDESKTIISDFSYDPKIGGIQFSTGVENIQISSLANFLPEKYSALANEWTIPLNGYFSFGLNQYLQFTNLNLDVYGQSKGQISLPSIYDEPLSLDAIDIQAAYNPETGELKLDHLFINKGDMTAEVAGRLYARENEDIVLESQVALYDLKVENLGRYWDQSWAPIAQDWVTTNIQKGLVSSGVLNLKMALPLDDILDEESDNLHLENFGGTLEFSGLEVDYFNPLPKAIQADGFIRFNDDDFIIFAESGTIENHDISLNNSIVHIKGLSRPINDYQVLSTDLNATVTLTDGLKLANHSPLELLSERDIKPEAYMGRGTVNLKLDFPLSKDLLLEDINIDIAGQLDELTIKDYIGEADVSSSNIALSITEDNLNIEGAVMLDGLGPFGLVWSEQFYPKTPSDISKRLTIQGNIMGEDIPTTQLPTVIQSTKLTGPIRIKYEDTEQDNGEGTSLINIDLIDTGMDIPLLEYQKAPGIDAKTQIELSHSDQAPVVKLDRFLFASDLLNIDIAGELHTDYTPLAVDINKYTSLRTDITGSVEQFQKGQYIVSLSGTSLDFSEGYKHLKNSMTSKVKAKTTPKEKTGDEDIPMSLALKTEIDRVFFDEKTPFKNLNTKIIYDGERFKQFHVDAHINKPGDIAIHYGAIMDGTLETNDKALKVTVENLGKTLKALNITDDLVNGRLSMNLRSPDWDKNQLEGQMVIKDFRLIEAPLLARLINALSPTGLLELLRDKGLEFQRMSTMVNVDNGIYKLKKGQLVGNSIGLSFDGTINPKKDNIDISGTVVPARGLNKVVGSIPIIGQILAGPDNKGVFGATYKIKGSLDKTTVSVNPLSVITPGILRSILFEGG